ncbi:unnamed protein product [Caenorhabditis brenneri]
MMTTERKPVMNLIEEMQRMMSMDTNQIPNLQESIRTNPYHRSLQSALVDYKENNPICSAVVKNDSEEGNEERLDNMLRAEGVVGPPRVLEDENKDYERHLNKAREVYEQKIEEHDRARVHFCENVRQILHVQGEFRPITQQASEAMMINVSKKINKASMSIKQKACEDVIQLRKTYYDARRKRKNFSQKATQILNAFFEAHITHPYPTEEEKHMLAMQCEISVSQVANWFGNKRIRFKKQIKNASEERRHAAMPTTPVHNPYQTGHHPFGFMPFGSGYPTPFAPGIVKMENA